MKLFLTGLLIILSLSAFAQTNDDENKKMKWWQRPKLIYQPYHHPINESPEFASQNANDYEYFKGINLRASCDFVLPRGDFKKFSDAGIGIQIGTSYQHRDFPLSIGFDIGKYYMDTYKNSNGIIMIDSVNYTPASTEIDKSMIMGLAHVELWLPSYYIQPFVSLAFGVSSLKTTAKLNVYNSQSTLTNQGTNKEFKETVLKTLTNTGGIGAGLRMDIHSFLDIDFGFYYLMGEQTQLVGNSESLSNNYLKSYEEFGYFSKNNFILNPQTSYLNMMIFKLRCMIRI